VNVKNYGDYNVYSFGNGGLKPNIQRMDLKLKSNEIYRSAAGNSKNNKFRK
jgi:hypothetical protein